MDQQSQELMYLRERPQAFFAKKRVWLNVLLFILTLLSTFFVGLTWSISFLYADTISEGVETAITPEILWNPEVVGLSVIYMLVLISILSAHEMGHFLTCRYYGLDATWPYFIPAPTLIGTFGAFIKIKSPITKKQQLFDVGIAGPLSGFVLAVPALIVGLSLSRPVPAMPREGSLYFGEPLILKIIGGIIFKGVPADFDIILHPVAFAGWVGILITFFNLFPVGQLDGGHVIYSLFGDKAKKLARIVLVLFIGLGVFFWSGWFLWVLLIALIGLKHPRIVDEDTPLSGSRRLIAFIILIIFLLSFIPDPIKGYGLIDLIK